MATTETEILDRIELLAGELAELREQGEPVDPVEHARSLEVLDRIEAELGDIRTELDASSVPARP